MSTAENGNAEEPSATASKTRARWPLAVGAAAAVLVTGYAAAVWYVSGDVTTGTKVRGVEIGGLGTDAAAAKLEKQLGKRAASAIAVSANGKQMVILPAKAGMQVDWRATAEKASGVVLSPLRLIEHLSGDVTLDPVVVVDEAKLGAALGALGEVANTEPQEPEITFTKSAQPKLTQGVAGHAIDVEAAMKAVEEGYLPENANADTGVVDLPLTTTEPTVSAKEAQKVFTEVAQLAVANDITLQVTDERSLTITPAQIAANLTFPVSDGTLVPTIDGKDLHKALADELKGVEQPGRNARFKIVNDKPVIVASKNGLAIDNDELAQAVTKVLGETDVTKRTAQVAVKDAKAEFSTADAEALNIKDKLSTFLQHFPPAAYRYINVGTAAARINGTVLKPGDVYSMNDTLGERTAANGYTKGFVISGGRFREELGGGVSIITTATWTAAFYAGLERLEQHAHGLYISRYTAGLEATVSWGQLDLRFRNDSGNGVLITATRYSDGVRITMWGTKKFDKVTATFTPRHNFTEYQTIYDDTSTCVPSEGVQGFQIAVTRRIIKDGKSIKTETWPTYYKATPHVICGPKPSPSPAPKPSSSATPAGSATPTS